MKRTALLIVSIMLAAPLSSAIAQDKTELSRKAAQLEVGMQRTEVISLLGPATWAVVSSDVGEFTIPHPDISLTLLWENRPARPVAVNFDHAGSVTGWDEGRETWGEDPNLFEPGDEYRCDQPNRAQFCH